MATKKRRSRSLDDEATDPPKVARKRKAPAKKRKQVATKSPPVAKDYLKDLRGLSSSGEEDFAAFSDPLAWVSSVTEWLPTGSLAIDRLIGGGYPVGRVVEIAAWEGVGKSTLLDQSIAMAQSEGAVCVLIDSEQARDAKYTSKLGVDLDSLIVYKAETVEEAFTGLDKIVAIQEAHMKELAKVGKQPPPMLVVWDSLGGTPTKAEKEGSASDHHVSDAARRVKLNLKRLNSRIAKARICFVFANQFYQEIGPFASIRSYGGSGVRFFTSVRLWLSRKGTLKVASNVVGHVIEAKLKKTRVDVPRPPVELGLIHGAGIHNAYTLYEWGKAAGVTDAHRWITQRGAWSYLMMPDGTHQAFQYQYLGFSDVLNQHPDIYLQMAQQYRDEGRQ